jgi:hypothetical protein
MTQHTAQHARHAGRALGAIMRTSIVVVATACILAAPVAVPATGEPEPEFDIRVAAQPVCEALKRLSEQTGLQFLCPTDAPASRGVTTNPVNGRYTVREGLTRMLRNKPVSWELEESFLSIKFAAPPADEPD